MSKKTERIAEVFRERWPAANLPDTDKLKFRGEIARELLNGETEEYRKTLQEEVDNLHEHDIEAYHASTMPPAVDDEEEKQRYVSHS